MMRVERWGKTDWRKAAYLAVLVMAVILLWGSVVVFPLKLLVVFFHEFSHGLAAVLTGGRIERIEINLMQGGVCWTRGGNSFLVYSAGYLGSLVFGGLVMVLAARTRFDKQLSCLLGAVLAGVALLYVPWLSAGWWFCVLLGAALAGAGYYLAGWVNEVVLMTIGVVSCLYAPLDILDDTVFRNLQQSDAARLGEMTYLSGTFWGVLWTLLAVAATLLFAFVATRRNQDSLSAPKD